MEMLILGVIMIMDNVDAEIMGQEIWLLYSVRDLLTLTAILNLISNKLNLDLNIQPLLMKLADCLHVEEDKMDNLDMDHLRMNLLQFMLAKFQIKSIKFHVERLIPSCSLSKVKFM